MDAPLRETPLTACHEEDGASFASFAGWRMPVRFAGTLLEHAAVRERVGVFDVSHLGTVWLRGAGAEAVVASTFTGDPARLDDGASQYTLCLDDHGGIVDDLIVTRLAADQWLAVPNAANTAGVVDALRAAAHGTTVEVADETDTWAMIAVQGPQALEVTDQVLATIGVVGRPAARLAPFAAALLDLGLICCRTGYTGERGVELVVAADRAVALYRALRDAGAEACGLGARDTLRLEMGYPLHGNELSGEVQPAAARLGWAVRKPRSGFRGARAIADAPPPTHRLWGLTGTGRRPLRAEADVLAEDGSVVGWTTSGSISPTLGVPIALAMLETTIEPGASLVVDVRGRREPVTVVRPPFVDRDPKA